jgi:predicted nucleic acid-binding protein
MNYVIDASVSVKWYIPEIYEQEATRLLKGKHRFHVPELILSEFANILWKKVRRGEIIQAEGERIVSVLARKRWSIHSHKNIIKSAYTGAEATGQTVYDWTYLALAISLSCEFVTADERFYKAIEQTTFKTNLKWIGDF